MARHLSITLYKCSGRSNGGQQPPNIVLYNADHATCSVENRAAAVPKYGGVRYTRDMMIGQSRTSVILCLCGLAFLMAADAHAQDSPPTREPSAPSAGPTAGSAELPALPSVQLAVPQPYEDERAYVDAKRAEVDELVALADQVDNPLEQCRHRLKAANVMLSYLVEPACSAKLLKIEPAVQSPIKDGIGGRLDEADRLLRRVEDTLAGVAKASETPDPRVSGLRHALETLDAFREAIGIFLLSETASEKTTSATRRAASQLSALLEDDNERISNAATFWQACLRERVSKPKRVRQLLGPVLADPPSGAVRLAFFSSLLSCRLLAKADGYVTSLALLTQLEARCNRWFLSKSDEHNASRAVALVEMQIVADWHRRLSDSKNGPTRTWCVERIRKLTEEHFSEDTFTVLRLSPAVPILELPEEQGPGRSKPEAQAPGQSEPRP